MTRELHPKELEALETARLLSRYMPVFLAPFAPGPGGGDDWDMRGGSGGSGYELPKNWQDSPVDPDVVGGWKPGMGIAMVTGHFFDAVDVDVQNGGSVEDIDVLLPRVYAHARTPSGGDHLLVASLGVRKCGDILPGIDFQAGDGTKGHGFIWLAPTIKRSKMDNQPHPYRWIKTPEAVDFGAVADDDTGASLLALVNRARGPERALHRPPVNTDEPPTPEDFGRAQAMLEGFADKVVQAEEGTRNNELFKWLAMAYQFVLGDCLDEGVVDEVMEQAALDAGLTLGEYETTRGSALRTAEDAGPDRPFSRGREAADEVFAVLAASEGPTDDELAPGATPPATGAENGLTEAWDPFAAWATRSSAHPWDVAADIAHGIRRTMVASHGEDYYGFGLVYWRGDWWRHRGSHWSIYDDDLLKRYLYRRLGVAHSMNSEGQTVDWAPGPGKIAAVMDALSSLLLRDPTEDQPSWMGPGTPVGQWMSCKSSIMRIGDRATMPHDPRFFTGFSVPFDYEPGADEPRKWLNFLKEVLPYEDERLLLQQWFGYCLSGRLDLEKALLLIGPRRSGKGTIATVLRALMGLSNVAAPKIATLGKDFGLQPLLDKTLAIVGDARMGDRVGLAATENLLGIIGRDAMDVGRKYRDAWTGVLQTRFLVMANDIPQFDDPSGAIMARFAMLRMRKSFYGREDFTLKNKILEELPGIFNWALDGLDALPDGESFVVPDSSVEASEDMAHMANPLAEWALHACVLDPLDWASTQELYDSYSSWVALHSGAGPDRRGVVHFARTLRSTFPDIHSARQGVTRLQVRGYGGIRLKNETDISMDELI